MRNLFIIHNLKKLNNIYIIKIMNYKILLIYIKNILNIKFYKRLNKRYAYNDEIINS